MSSGSCQSEQVEGMSSIWGLCEGKKFICLQEHTGIHAKGGACATCLASDWLKRNSACIWHVDEVVCNLIHESWACDSSAVSEYHLRFSNIAVTLMPQL